MSTRSLRSLFNPASVVLIGASERPGSLGAALTRNLLSGNFKGELFLVNRRHRRVQGMPAVAHPNDLPHPPELALIATPPPTLPDLLVALGQRGTRIAVIAIAAGSPDDARLWRTVAAAHGLRLIGPGSFGLILPQRGLNASLSHACPPSGHLALVAADGSMLTPVLEWADAHSIGFSSVIALGRDSDLQFSDLLDGLSRDPATRAILLVLETLHQARAFLSAARAAARVKPVLAVRVGRGSSAESHQTDAIYDAAFQRVGLLRVASLRELCWAAETLALDLPVTGDRLAILGNSRGLGLLAADALFMEGGRLAQWSPAARTALAALLPPGLTPDPPLDLGVDADPARFAAALKIVLQEPEIDGVLILYAPSALTPIEATATALSDLLRSQRPVRPGILTCGLGVDSAHTARQLFLAQGIVHYDTLDDAIRAFMQRWRQQRNQQALMETPPDTPERFRVNLTAAQQPVQTALAAGRCELTVAETQTLLAAYGIALATDGTEPARAVPPGAPTLTLRMISDPTFGPVLRFGPGGESAMFTEEFAIALPPLNQVLAREALARINFGARLQRAGAAAALDDFVLLLIQVAQLVTDLGNVTALELEPIFVLAEGAVVGAARIDVTASTEPAHRRLAIRPYPRELEETLPLPDGSTLLIRPVRPEDEPALIAGFARLSTEDIRMRFMHTVKELTHADAARLTQLDYDREMALGAVRQRPGQPPEGCGVARVVGDAERERAEFAIILLRDAVGMGLGSLLLRRLIHYAREQGFRELFGEILRENEPMLMLCRAMGFTTTPCPQDHGVIIATLALT